MNDRKIESFDFRIKLNDIALSRLTLDAKLRPLIPLQENKLLDSLLETIECNLYVLNWLLNKVSFDTPEIAAVWVKKYADLSSEEEKYCQCLHQKFSGLKGLIENMAKDLRNTPEHRFAIINDGCQNIQAFLEENNTIQFKSSFSTIEVDFFNFTYLMRNLFLLRQFLINEKASPLKNFAYFLKNHRLN